MISHSACNDFPFCLLSWTEGLCRDGGGTRSPHQHLSQASMPRHPKTHEQLFKIVTHVGVSTPGHESRTHHISPSCMLGTVVDMVRPHPSSLSLFESPRRRRHCCVRMVAANSHWCPYGGACTGVTALCGPDDAVRVRPCCSVPREGGGAQTPRFGGDRAPRRESTPPCSAAEARVSVVTVLRRPDCDGADRKHASVGSTHRGAGPS